MASVKSLTIGGKTIFDLFYPVGSIYETESSSFNPNNSFGGTWQRIQGKMLVGMIMIRLSMHLLKQVEKKLTH